MTIPDTLTDLTIPLASVKPHPANPNEGDIGAISISLETFGQYRPIVVQTSTMRIVAGNHTWRAAKALNWTTIAATFIDVDDDTALRILLADNRLAQLASYDAHQLTDLLADIGVDNLDGTGWDADDLATLLSDQETPFTFTPTPSDEQPRLDQIGEVTCPECGHEFAPS